MKRLLLKTVVISCVILLGQEARGQDIPLFSQKLTNSFIFNPALAGNTFGSITYSYKQNYARVNGSPKNNFLSFHTPIANHRFGIGANVFQEDVNFLRNTYASAAFAYHLRFDKFSTFSMGVSGEYNSLGINGTSNSSATSDDVYKPLIQGIHDYDFSFGMHYQNRILKVGLAANRLGSTWLKGDKAVLSYFYSGYAQGLIPLRGGEDLLEPYVAYRKLSESNNTLDIGLFYTYNNLITIGASERSGKVLSATLALHISKYLTVGYSRETILGGIGGFVGAANEITLRYDFNNESYKEHFKSDYKSSIAYRRKTLSGPTAKKTGRSPKQLHRSQKKLAPYSPNRRYQNIKKLGVKVPPGKRKSNSKHKGKKSPSKRRR